MSVKFGADLKTLVHDLESRGFRVRKAEMIAGSPGRTADVFLENDVLVQWDAYSQKVWTDGPVRPARRTERYLRCIYEGGVFGQLWVSSIYGAALSLRFLRTKLLQMKRSASKKVATTLTPSLPVAKPLASPRTQPRAAPFSIV